MDKLEDFINQNREDFDSPAPTDTWRKIEPELKKTNPGKGPKWPRLAVAASLLILVGFGAWWITQQSHDDPNKHGAEQVADDEQEQAPDAVDLGEVSPEYAEIEGHYIQLVDQRMDELDALNPDPEFLEDLKELEEEYQFLKEELGAGGDDERIIQAMIENYRLKLRVLESILDRLKTENHEVEIDAEV